MNYEEGTLLKAWKKMFLLIIADCHLSWSGCGEVCRVVWFYSKGSSEPLLSPCYDPIPLVHIPRQSMCLLPTVVLLPTNILQFPFSVLMLVFAEMDPQWISTLFEFVFNSKRLFFLQRAKANSCIIYDYIRSLDFCLQILYEMCKVRWSE